MAYAAGDILARVVMEASSGLPEDRIINDFAFHFALEPDNSDLTDLSTVIDAFYNTGQGANLPVGGYISSFVDRGSTHVIQFYKIQSGPLGSPRFEIPWLGPQAPNNNNNLPSEVAACASFHATLVGSVEDGPGTTRPRARRRGRVYIGPLTVDSMDDPVAPAPVVSDDFGTALRFAMAEMRDYFNAPVGWCVWSRADEVLRLVTGGWTDNAFDTQRRRGQNATNRVLWGNP